MPGTRARRASQYRAWARSLKLVGQRPTPANGVKYRSTACLKAHRRPFVSQAADQLCPTGCSKRPDFSPTQPWRLLHPPALSLPRQTLRPETRLSQARPPRVKPRGGTHRTLWGRSPLEWILANGKAPTVIPASEKLFLNVEGLNDARTKLEACFSILLVEGERNRSKGKGKHGKCNPPDSDPLSAQRY